MRFWPFSKKEAKKTNVDAINQRDILSPFQISFNSLGSVSVDWVHVVSKKQNDILLIDYFNQLAEVSSPIRKYTDQLKNIKLYLLDNEGKEVENDELLSLVNKFWNESAELAFIYKLLLGNVYIQAADQFQVGNLETKTLTELILLPSEYTSINLVQDSNIDFRTVEIKNYEVNFENDSKYKPLTILADNVLHIKNAAPFKDSSNSIYGISKLASAEKNLQAIASGYGARIALYDNGPRVILTGKQQGGDEFKAVNETEETEEIQTRVNNVYGRTDGQYQFFVTKSALDATVVSLNVKDLQLNELNSADFRRICNVFNQDSKIHGDPESTTYDNMQTALTDFNINAFKPEVDSFLRDLSTLTKSKGFEKINIKADYSGIKEISQFEKQYHDELFRWVETGMMTRNEYLEQVGQPTVNLPEFSEYMTYYNGRWLSVNYEPNEQTGNNSEFGADNTED